MERQGSGSQGESRGQESSATSSGDGSEIEALTELIGGEAFEQVPSESRDRIVEFVSIFNISRWRKV